MADHVRAVRAHRGVQTRTAGQKSTGLGIVAALDHGLAGAQVFDAHVELGVVGVEAFELVVNGHGARDVAEDDEGFGEAKGEFLVFGRVFAGDLEGEDGGLREVGLEGGFGEGFVGEDVVGVAVEGFFGGAEGFEGVAAELDLGLGEGGGVADAAQHLLEEAAAAAGFLELGAAELFAAFVEAGFFGEDLVEDDESVVEVIALNGGNSFFKQLAFHTGNFVERLLWHAGIVFVPGKISSFSNFGHESHSGPLVLWRACNDWTAQAGKRSGGKAKG